MAKTVRVVEQLSRPIGNGRRGGRFSTSSSSSSLICSSAAAILSMFDDAGSVPIDPKIKMMTSISVGKYNYY